MRVNENTDRNNGAEKGHGQIRKMRETERMVVTSLRGKRGAENCSKGTNVLSLGNKETNQANSRTRS